MHTQVHEEHGVRRTRYDDIFHLSGSGYVSQTRQRDNNLGQKKNRCSITYCYFESQFSYQAIKICYLTSFKTHVTLHFYTYTSVVILWFNVPQTESTGTFQTMI